MIDYKSFDPTKFKVETVQDAIDILEMFAFQFYQKECAMSPRDEKWGAGIMLVHTLLKKLKDGTND